MGDIYSRQWDFTAPFEGIVPHLYLDTRGNVTCGVGFLIADDAALRRFPWSPSTQSAVADYRLVLEAAPGRPARWYAQFCVARLSEAAMRQAFNNRVVWFRRALADWHLERQPEAVQIALIDMAYNLGVAGLTRFKRLRAAVDAQDWDSAALESSRLGVQSARNIATARLMRLPMRD